MLDRELPGYRSSDDGTRTVFNLMVPYSIVDAMIDTEDVTDIVNALSQDVPSAVWSPWHNERSHRNCNVLQSLLFSAVSIGKYVWSVYCWTTSQARILEGEAQANW